MDRQAWYNQAIRKKEPEFPSAPGKENIVVAISKAQRKAVKKYVALNYDRISLTVTKGRRDIIKAHAISQGESVNGFVNRAINEAMERDKAAPEDGEKIE